MKDIMGLMKQAKEMQSRMQAMQEELTNLEAEGVAAGGVVKITLNGKGEMRGISIDPDMLKKEDIEVVEDLIIAAHNQAKTKAEEMAAEKTASITAGLPIPPGMKLPFG